jgi:hypothetical protein
VISIKERIALYLDLIFFTAFFHLIFVLPGVIYMNYKFVKDHNDYLNYFAIQLLWFAILAIRFALMYNGLYFSERYRS